MPINAFRSWADSPTFKGRQTDMAISMLQVNYTLLGQCFFGNELAIKAQSQTYSWEQYNKDISVLRRLKFIYCCDRLRAAVDDTLRIFIEDRPQRILTLIPEITAKLPKEINKDSLRPLIERAGDIITRGSIRDVHQRFKKKFGHKFFTEAELSYLNYVFCIRNMLVHRGERVDERFIRETGSRINLGSELSLPDVHRLSIHLIRLPLRLATRLEAVNQADFPRNELGNQNG